LGIEVDGLLKGSDRLIFEAAEELRFPQRAVRFIGSWADLQGVLEQFDRLWILSGLDLNSRDLDLRFGPVGA
jgi:hypothetical protein